MALSDAHESKIVLRSRLRDIVSKMSLAERELKSREIVSRVLELPVFKRALRILVYKALRSEVDTDGLIRQCLITGKEVYVPSIMPRSEKLEIFRIMHLDRDFRRGAHGLLEPKRYILRRGRICDMDTAVIPGLGFDASGARLGRGKGYFDRFLEGSNHVYKIGLCFREQCVEQVPAERHDVRMDIVIHD